MSDFRISPRCLRASDHFRPDKNKSPRLQSCRRQEAQPLHSKLAQQCVKHSEQYYLQQFQQHLEQNPKSCLHESFLEFVESQQQRQCDHYQFDDELPKPVKAGTGRIRRRKIGNDGLSAAASSPIIDTVFDAHAASSPPGKRVVDILADAEFRSCDSVDQGVLLHDRRGPSRSEVKNKQDSGEVSDNEHCDMGRTTDAWGTTDAVVTRHVNQRKRQKSTKGRTAVFLVPRSSRKMNRSTKGQTRPDDNDNRKINSNISGKNNSPRKNNSSHSSSYSNYRDHNYGNYSYRNYSYRNYSYRNYSYRNYSCSNYRNHNYGNYTYRNYRYSNYRNYNCSNYVNNRNTIPLSRPDENTFDNWRQSAVAGAPLLSQQRRSILASGNRVKPQTNKPTEPCQFTAVPTLSPIHQRSSKAPDTSSFVNSARRPAVCFACGDIPLDLNQAGDSAPLCQACKGYDPVETTESALEEVRNTVEAFGKSFGLVFSRKMLFLTAAVNLGGLRSLFWTQKSAKQEASNNENSSDCPAGDVHEISKLHVPIDQREVQTFLASLEQRPLRTKVDECIPFRLVPPNRLVGSACHRHPSKYQMACCLCRRCGAFSQLSNAKGKQMERWIHEIQVVKGLPRELFASLVAHELLHAYFWLRGGSALPLEMEEGLCNAMSFCLLKTTVRRKRAELSTILEQMECRESASAMAACPADKRKEQNVLRQKAEKIQRAIRICEYRCKKLSHSEGVEFHRACEAALTLGWEKLIGFVETYRTLPRF